MENLTARKSTSKPRWKGDEDAECGRRVARGGKGGGVKEGGDGDATSTVLSDASAVGPGLPPEEDEFFKVGDVLCFLCVLCVCFFWGEEGLCVIFRACLHLCFVVRFVLCFV